jgi:CheY-like chemotaxis protein
MAVVLIAGADEDTRRVLETMFTGHGLIVLTVPDGAAALQEANRRLPDLMITAMDMPGMDGLHLCRAVRMHPRLRKVPVVLLSGSLRVDDPRVRTAQVCAVLTGPADGVELMDAVEILLHRGGHAHGVLTSACAERAVPAPV